MVDYLTNLRYTDYLVDGVPIWEVEHRGMTEEEAEAYREEVIRIGKSKVADMAAANLSRRGLLVKEEEDK